MIILPKQNDFDPNYYEVFLSIDKEFNKNSSFMIELSSRNDWDMIMTKLEDLGILWLTGHKPTSLDFYNFDKGNKYYIFIEKNDSSYRISTSFNYSINYYESKKYGVPINSKEYWKNLI